MFHGTGLVNVKFEPLHFLLSDRKDLILLIVGLVIAGGVATVKPVGGLIVIGIVLVVVLMSVFGTARGAFQGNGDLVPAMVIDPKRNLIAAYTDLNKDGEGMPVIQVFKAPLSRLPDAPLKAGTRLAMVVMYNGFAHESNWRNFGGWLIHAGTKNKKVIQRAIESFDDDDWEILKDGIRQIKKPYRVKLYKNLDL